MRQQHEEQRREQLQEQRQQQRQQQHGVSRWPARRLPPAVALAAVAAAVVAACGGSSDDDEAAQQAALVAEGQQTFRYDTFGDEAQWTDALRMHEVISAAVDPVTALSVGLKVDAQALPPAVVAGIQDGSIDLTSPATTIALLKLDAVVGLKGTVETVNGVDKLSRVGITQSSSGASPTPLNFTQPIKV